MHSPNNLLQLEQALTIGLPYLILSLCLFGLVTLIIAKCYSWHCENERQGGLRFYIEMKEAFSQLQAVSAQRAVAQLEILEASNELESWRSTWLPSPVRGAYKGLIAGCSPDAPGA
jgi:hypothetical protein